MTVRTRLLQQVFRSLRQATSRVESVSKAALEHPTVTLVACAPQQSKRMPWSCLGYGFAAASLVTVASPLEASCSPAVAAPQTAGVDLSNAGMTAGKAKLQVIFVLGGPGSGKGTQCAKLVQEFGLLHLSAGDLLRAHMKSGTPDGNMVAEMIKQGQIVPSRVTISLLEEAMLKGGKQQVLIDGFPRNEENRAAFEAQTGIEPEFVLFFNCPEAVMEKRLLGRQEGRTDDNIETIRKRFKVFMESSMPIINFYDAKGRVRKIDADRDPEDVYADVRPLVEALQSFAV
ncbi:g11159 [Coccomyxa viridis]|uniref:UMP-CMP kinase n=1 Tax=Coccomyxa viridis TaxID=1274662 RepID=A0ABP1G773_9CHLO